MLLSLYTSSFVTTYLRITLYRCGAIGKVQPLEYGILAKCLFNVQHGLLHTPFTFKALTLCSTLTLQLLIIGKQVELHYPTLSPATGILLGYNMIGC